MLVNLCAGLRCRSSVLRSLSTRIIDPVAFDSTFEAPIKECAFPLEINNAHAKDSMIAFDEASHTYKFNDQPLTRSVTAAIGAYFEKFDPDAAVQLMMKGKKWPKPEYVDENGVPHTPEMIMKSWELNGELARNRGIYVY